MAVAASDLVVACAVYGMVRHPALSCPSFIDRPGRRTNTLGQPGLWSAGHVEASPRPGSGRTDVPCMSGALPVDQHPQRPDGSSQARAALPARMWSMKLLAAPSTGCPCPSVARANGPLTDCSAASTWSSPLHPAVEVAQHEERNSFGPALRQPALQHRHLAPDGGALLAAVLRVEPVALAPGLQVNGQAAEAAPLGRFEGDVDVR